MLTAAALLLTAPLAAQRFVGAANCASCHTDQSARHNLTSHAHALSRASEHRLANDFAGDAGRPPGFRFVFSSRDGAVHMEASSEDDHLEMDVEWAFGAGSQGVTFVSRGNEAWYLEHSMTYFPADGVFDRTPGHDHAAKNLTEAAGILYPLHDPEHGVAQCFECHSTGPVSAPPAGIRVSEQGVQCESCHGPGGDHVTAVKLGETAAARASITNPGSLDPRALSDLCGQCHRPPGAADASGFDPSDPWNVRHAPPYLDRSACFRQSGELSCSNCHPAHEPLAHAQPAVYARRCRECHESVEHTTTVNQDSCVECHMPTVRPHPRLAFTNHWIGVYAPGENLEPIPTRKRRR